MSNKLTVEAVKASSEDFLHNLIKSWRSRYRYFINFKSQNNTVVTFDTTWCRRPTPHVPLPDIRVGVEFSLKYARDVTASNAKTAQPTVSFRIEHESFIHTVMQNMDLHILRVLKCKTEFFKRNPLKLEQAEVLESRLAQEAEAAADTTEVEVEDDTVSMSSQDIEKYLIGMFAKADGDGNGCLDKAEVTEMLMGSDLKFTKEDVDVVISSNDVNGDGFLVFREFIPIAIDLVQAQQASQYAIDITEKNKAKAYAKCLDRVQSAKKLPRLVEQLSVLDLENTGLLSSKQLRVFLSQLPVLSLTAEEVDAVMAKLPSSGEEVMYQEFLNDYERILTSTLATFSLDQSASNVELFLVHLFRKQDPQALGTLAPEEIVDVLETCERIKLTSTQIHAIMSTYKGQTEIDFQFFARKAAFMIYKLFDKVSLKEKTTVIKRSQITPVEVLGGKSRKLILKQMRAKFREFDSNDDGLLDKEEFARCLADTSLCLSRTHIDKLRDEADENDDGFISMEEFMQFAYDTLLQLARDAALSSTASKPEGSAS